MSPPVAPPPLHSVFRHLPLIALLVVVASGAMTAWALRPRATGATDPGGEVHRGTPAQLAGRVEQRIRDVQREGGSSPLLVLEVEHPAPRPVAARPSSAPAAPDTHVVQRGEGLGVIAARYGTTIRALVAENGIRDPGQLRVGQRLAIPSPASRARRADTATAASATDSAAAVVYAMRALAPLAAAVNRAPATLGMQLRIDSASADSIRPLLAGDDWTSAPAPGGETVWRRAQSAPVEGRDLSWALPFAVQLGVGLLLLGLWRVARRRALAPVVVPSTSLPAPAPDPTLPPASGASIASIEQAGAEGKQDAEQPAIQASDGADPPAVLENSASPIAGEIKPGPPAGPENRAVNKGSAGNEDGGTDKEDGGVQVPGGPSAGGVIETVHSPVPPVPPAGDGRGQLATVRTQLAPDGYVLIDGCLVRAWLEEAAGESPWIGEQVYVRPDPVQQRLVAFSTDAEAAGRHSSNGDNSHAEH